MARKITDYDGIIIPVSGTDPYGNIKNNPSGTVIDSVSNSDIQVFFQRIAAMNGVALNSQPDNAVNGFQFVQAFNKAYGNYDSAWAMTMGAQAGSTQAVRLTGCTSSIVSSTWVIAQGYLFYNGQLCYCVGQSFPLSGGSHLQATVIFIDGLATIAVTATGATPVTNSTEFDFNAIINWSAAVGIDALNSKVALGAWTALTLNSGWTAGAVVPQYRVDGMGRVYLKGSADATTTPPTSSVMATLPVAARPASVMGVPNLTITGGVSTVKNVTIGTSGDIAPNLPSTISSGDIWLLDGINYLNS